MSGPRYIERHAFSPSPLREGCWSCQLPYESEAHYVIESAEDYQKRTAKPEPRYDPTSLQRAFDLLKFHLQTAPDGGPCRNPAHIIDKLNEAGFDLVRKQ